MKKDLTKLYGQLTGEERFKLTLAAIARGDEGELEHLNRTCPRKAYDVADPACKDRFLGSQYVALVFALDWMEQERAYSIIKVGTELMVLAVKNFLSGYSRGITAVEEPDKSYLPFMAPGDEKLLTVARSELPEGYVNTLLDAKRKLKGVLEAFETFCRDVDVPPDYMLVWVPYIKNQIETYGPILADVQPDETTTLLYMNLYRDFWTKKTGHKFDQALPVA
jgi:hypothetical protein